ncbi:MAG: rhodanese-like domain-containing protein [Rhodoferax sp.]
MIEQIRPSQLTQWVATASPTERPVLLDVREPLELQRASVQPEGFERVCIPMGLIPPRLHELDPDRPVACLCHHGGRSMQVASFLKARGFARVANIAGGIDAWSRELDPSVPRY